MKKDGFSLLRSPVSSVSARGAARPHHEETDPEHLRDRVAMSKTLDPELKERHDGRGSEWRGSDVVASPHRRDRPVVRIGSETTLSATSELV